MRMSEQQGIRDRTAAIVGDWAEGRQPPFTGETMEGFVEAITVAHLVADEGRIGLHRWVDAARRTGLSWTEIGDALGISKQAAQQRFKPLAAGDDLSDDDGAMILRLGATALNEMAIMRKEGRNGNELVRTGALMLAFRQTGQVWEYRRRIGGAAMKADMAKAGWSYVSSWLPFHYFKRPVPAETA